MMRFGHYRLAFLLSILIFVVLISLYLSLPKIKNKDKNPIPSVIKITLLTPMKPIPKIQQKVITPLVPMVKKSIIKAKRKKIIKKKRAKKRAKKRVRKKTIKRIHKKVHHKKVHHKKVHHKKIIHKPINNAITNSKSVIPKKITPPITPIYNEYKPKIQQNIATPHPTIIPTSIRRPKPYNSMTKASPKKDNGHAKKIFLNHIRERIISNKKYPKLALRRHIEGATKVRFDITLNGTVTNIRFISGRSIFHKSIRNTLNRTFPITIPSNMQGKLPIYDVTVTLHFNIE